MLSLPGQFTFTADRPQLHCAAFLIAEPEEFITIHYDLVSIDCQGGDFLKVRPPASARRGSSEGAPVGVRCPGRGARSGVAEASPGRRRGANFAPHLRVSRLASRRALDFPRCAPGSPRFQRLELAACRPV